MMQKRSIAAACLGAAVAAGAGAFPIYEGAGFAIPDNNPVGASSTIVINDFGIVGMVRVELVGLTHTWAGDLTATLSNGSATVDLFRRVGFTGTGFGTSANFDGNYLFEDGYSTTLWDVVGGLGTNDVVPSGNYAASGASGAPVSLLTPYWGIPTAGNWTLTLTDSAGGDLGSLEGWRLQLVFPSPGAGGLAMLAGMVAARRRR